MSEVEVYDLDRNNWRVINYISEKNRLSIIHPGAVQISGKKIMIFGGIVPPSSNDEEDRENQALECGYKISVTN